MDQLLEIRDEAATPATPVAPEAELYEKALQYWPYRKSQQEVLGRVQRLAPKNGQLLDIMCGPGNLLGRIAEARPDLTLTGVDIDPRYIQYGNFKYPQARFHQGDVLTWQPETPPDIIVCTGAMHHVPHDLQEAAIRNIASMMRPEIPLIFADCYIDPYTNEEERQKAARRLGLHYIEETRRNGAPENVITATIDILENDVRKREFKTFVQQHLAIFRTLFSHFNTQRIWPVEPGSAYGDYIHACWK